MSPVYLMGKAALNIIGAMVYVTRVLERLHVQRFDIWCQKPSDYALYSHVC